MYIANCTQGEVITLDCVHKLITTSLASHEIANDFNYTFFRLVVNFNGEDYIQTANSPELHSLYGTSNILSPTLACSVQIKYTPIYKVVF